jgi:hypothetical protein
MTAGRAWGVQVIMRGTAMTAGRRRRYGVVVMEGGAL